MALPPTPPEQSGSKNVRLTIQQDESIVVTGKSYHLRETIKAMIIPGFTRAKWHADKKHWFFEVNPDAINGDSLERDALNTLLDEYTDQLNAVINKRSKSIKAVRQESAKRARETRNQFKAAMAQNELHEAVCRERSIELKRRTDALLEMHPPGSNTHYFIEGSWLAQQTEKSPICFACRNNRLRKFGDESVAGMSFDELFAGGDVLKLLHCPFCGDYSRSLLNFN